MKFREYLNENKEANYKKEAKKLLDSGKPFDWVVKDFMSRYKMNKQTANALVDMGRLSESKDITKEVIKLLKKGSVMVDNGEGMLVNIDSYEDGEFFGMDQHDNDKELSSLKGFTLAD
jgi:hypothetical protein